MSQKHRQEPNRKPGRTKLARRLHAMDATDTHPVRQRHLMAGTRLRVLLLSACPTAVCDSLHAAGSHTSRIEAVLLPSPGQDGQVRAELPAMRPSTVSGIRRPVRPDPSRRHQNASVVASSDTTPESWFFKPPIDDDRISTGRQRWTSRLACDTWTRERDRWEVK